MILSKFRVTEFRSVTDSNWIEADKITAFIGTNESGKTNILLPLWKLNPASGGEINLKEDLPRDKFHIYRSMKKKPIFISAEYTLNEDEQKSILAIASRELSGISTVTISRDFDGNYFMNFPNLKDEPISGESILEILSQYENELSASSSAPEEEQQRRVKAIEIIQKDKENYDSSENVLLFLKQILTSLEVFPNEKSSTSQIKICELRQILSEKVVLCEKPVLKDDPKIIEFIKGEMPKYVYYSNYGNLDSEIYLPQVIQNFGRTDLGEKDKARVRTLNTLFKFVNLDPKEILSMGNEVINGQPLSNNEQIEQIAQKKTEREILLHSASSSFTRSFNEWWKQGNYTFEFQADGNFFRIWVSDQIRPEKIELEARSTGLQWFFSFYLIFLVESNLHHRNAILLLDEPGVTLHPLAQKDLFLFFDNLAQNNQIMYTTHSPFMVDSNHLERVRSVYIDSKGKTIVSPDLRASERQLGKNQSQSIYPAHAALGLTVSDTLLINCNPILVEGESDQIYLSALKSLLVSYNKISPLKELVFIPTGGIRGIKATASIVTGVNSVKPFVLTDGDKPGTKILTELKSDFYASSPERLINISEYTHMNTGEIEDLFPINSFARIVSKFLPRPEEVEEEFEDYVNDKDPMCNQIENYAKKYNIPLRNGWKVRLAINIKHEIMKGKGSIISDKDNEFEKVISLFKLIEKD